MIAPILMSIPAALQASVQGGTAQVIGAIVKDVATGQVLGHLQPTTALTQMLLSANPIALATQAGSAVLQSVQLLRIERLLDSVKLISTVGAAASVLNLGVCLGGFAMVLSALRKVDAKLDAVGVAIEKLGQREDAKLVAAVRVALERAEDAFTLAPDDRRDRWLRCDERLHELSGLLVQLLDRNGLPLTPTQAGPAQQAEQAVRKIGEPEVLELLVYLLTVQRANVEALLCLGRPGLAARAARRAEGWMKQLPRDGRAIAVARTAGRPLAGPQIKRVAEESASLGRWVAASESAAQQQALICERLEADGVDSQQYVLEVRNTAEPKLLFYSFEKGAA